MLELAHDLGVMHLADDQTVCMTQYTGELRRWEDSFRRGAPLKQAGKIVLPGSRTFYTDLWMVAQTGQVASHFPLEERNRYAQFYGQIRANEVFAQQRRDQWQELLDFDGADRLDHQDLMRLHGLIGRIERSVGNIKANLALMEERARALGVSAEKLSNPTAQCPHLLAEH